MIVQKMLRIRAWNSNAELRRARKPSPTFLFIPSSALSAPPRLRLSCLTLCLGLITTILSGFTLAQDDYDGQIKRSFTEPIQRSIVSTNEIGIVREITVDEGEYVKNGDALGRLNDEVLKQSLRLAKARVESSANIDALRSRMEMLQQRTEKVEQLAEGGHANPYELEQIRTEFVTATSEYRAAVDERGMNKIEVERIEAQLQERKIEAPFDGFVVQIHKSPGELITGTEPQFATLVRLDELKAKFYLRASELEKLNLGDNVAVEVGGKRDSRRAVVSYVSPIIDPDSGTGRVDVRIENARLKIRSGTVCFWTGNAWDMEELPIENEPDLRVSWQSE